MQDEMATSTSTRPSQTARLWLGLLAIAALAVTTFVLFPGIDLAISNLFIGPDKVFVGRDQSIIAAVRAIFSWTFAALCLLSVIGLFTTRDWRSRFMSLSFAQWLYLAACLGAGPGLVANLGLKDHWGRARPATVIEFGGTRVFTSINIPGKECDRNCAFVSGEASSIYMAFFAAAFLFPSRAAALWLSGIIFGSAAGLIRIAQGGHFLSDVIFAGIFMAMTAAALDYAFRAIAATSKGSVDKGDDA